MQNTPFLKQILKLAVPVALQSALVSTLGMVDVVMVSTLGAAEIAAVGLGAKIHFVAIMIMASLGTGCSVMVAQYWGTRNHQGVQRITALAMVLGLFLLLPLTWAFYLQPAWFVGLATTDPAVLGLGADYLRITFPLLMLTHVIIIYESGMRAMAQPSLALWTSAGAIGINILLNYMLILGNWGMPALGIAGAAWATVLSRLLQLGIVLTVLQFKRHPLWFNWFTTLVTLPRTLVDRYWQVTWPLLINFTVWGVGMFTYNLIAGRLGTEPLAVLTVIGPIESLSFALFFGLCSACSVIIGHRLGRDQFDEARAIARGFLWFTPLAAFVVGMLLLLIRPWVLALFGDMGEETGAMADSVYAIMCFALCLKTLNLVLIQGILRTGGDNRYCLYVDMLAMWIIGLPLTALAAFYWDLPYTWVFAMALGEEITKTALNLKRFRRGVWLRNLTNIAPQAA